MPVMTLVTVGHQTKRKYFMVKVTRPYPGVCRPPTGSFFSTYPRNRRLISINKRYTGRSNQEFNLRHDWNSLLSDDPSLLYKHFSADFFPEADTMVRYLNEYTVRLGLRVQYNTAVQRLRRMPGSGQRPGGYFTMRDQHNRPYTCKYVIVATGLSMPNSPTFPGSELVQGYEDVENDPTYFEGKSVLILGRGNAAFETADSIYGSTSTVHMVSRSRTRLSWNTHYVGDLRAINNGLLDTYQLKSLDGLLEAAVEDMVLERRDGRIFVQFPWDAESRKYVLAKKELGEEVTTESDFDNFSLREGYDHVIRCLGFNFDFSIFENSTLPGRSTKKSKFPGIKHTYEAQNVPGLFFAGTITHSLDYRKSAGGFIHGFRYTVRSLHRLLEWRLEGQRWPVKSYSTRDLLNVLVRRINEASATYQMFGVLSDIVLLSDGGQTFEFLEEFPVQLLSRLEELTGRKVGEVIVVLMEYGPDFSGPDKDTFKIGRAIGDPAEAHRSNFLHPVFYYYKKIPTESEMMSKWGKLILPRPTRIHHVLEDFLTLWTAQQSHILLLRRFLEYVTGRDLRHHHAHSCLAHALTNGHPPPLCSLDGKRSVWNIHTLASPLTNTSKGSEFVAPAVNLTSAVPTSQRPSPAATLAAATS
ncbi:FAD-dependent oxidoreductase domain-containing protein 2-like [Homarus americanus]|uniref:FAD-dependent oxidoreductase domain-containing protein 2-like n=1 Tax=Homarus americanus TaxID=6706 RepID=A0A8J5JPQ7_HOMAM|nr:FAD-dependent oxidoreductase domain-containing protein 2-like [Homarus americanus]